MGLCSCTMLCVFVVDLLFIQCLVLLQSENKLGDKGEHLSFVYILHTVLWKMTEE